MQNKFIALACVGFLLCVGPAKAQVFNPQSMILKNGMQVVVLPNPRAPVVTHMIWVRAGAANDPWGTSGIAHFLEHLMFKGTKNHPAGEYSKIISHMGGEENAFTSDDYTAYYATIGKENLEKIMELESDRFANWEVREEDIKTEREVILKEREQRTENDPISAFFEEVGANLFVNHPYQRPTIGWRSEMEKLSRQDAENFLRAHYIPREMTLILSGDVTLKKVRPLVEKYYSGLKNHDIPEAELPEVMELKADRRIQQTSDLVKETLWSRSWLADPARPETIADSDALMVLTKILGDSRTGRLYRRLVVQDQIATAAYASYDQLQRGKTRVSIVVTPKPGTDLKIIAKAVEEEIEKIRTGDIPLDEVKKATQSLEVETIYARDGVMGPAMIVGSALASGLDLKTVEAWPWRMKAVTPEAVGAQAKKLFDPARGTITAILLPEVKK